MAMIADILMVAGALGAGFYCLVLARRLRRFTDLEKGVGGAVAVLSAQVDDLTKSLENAQVTANGSVGKLTDVSARAEKAARHLELLVASLHDVPDNEPDGVAPPPAAAVNGATQDTPPKVNPFFVKQDSPAEAKQ